MNNLQKIREFNNISQKKLGELSGVSFRMIQNYEQDVRDINKAQAITVFKLAKALGCRMEDLIQL